MKRTNPGVLVVAAVIAAGAGFLFDQLRSAAGAPTFTPQASLPVLLVAVGVVVVAFAVPIRRATRPGAQVPVNPFRAVRVAMLAKASSLVGAVCTGFAVGLVVFVMTRPVSPPVGSMSALIATAVCAGFLVAAGLVAEHLCTIRKDDDDGQHGGQQPGPDRPRVEGPGGRSGSH